MLDAEASAVGDSKRLVEQNAAIGIAGSAFAANAEEATGVAETEAAILAALQFGSKHIGEALGKAAARLAAKLVDVEIEPGPRILLELLLAFDGEGQGDRALFAWALGLGYVALAVERHESLRNRALGGAEIAGECGRRIGEPVGAG